MTLERSQMRETVYHIMPEKSALNLHRQTLVNGG